MTEAEFRHASEENENKILGLGKNMVLRCREIAWLDYVWLAGTPPRPDEHYVHTGVYSAGSFVRGNFSLVPPKTLLDLGHFVLKFGKKKMLT